MVGVYHVVCHECPFEGLYSSLNAARDERAQHEREYRHSVTHLEIDRPASSMEA